MPAVAFGYRSSALLSSLVVLLTSLAVSIGINSMGRPSTPPAALSFSTANSAACAQIVQFIATINEMGAKNILRSIACILSMAKRATGSFQRHSHLRPVDRSRTGTSHERPGGNHRGGHRQR